MKKKASLNRRDFLASSGAVALGLGTFSTGRARGAEKKEKVNVGLIGCGDRGVWLGDFCVEHGGYKVAAAGDYFKDRVDAAGDKFNIPANRRFTTLSCYNELLECKEIDAVLIESPPYFHPEQAAAAVDAGKHVFLAKPIAVDVPGCRTIEECGKKATEKDLAFIVDFQTRAMEPFITAIGKVHNGAIGNMVFGETYVHTGPAGVKAEPGSPEARLRNWHFYKALSGDIITEQNIHTLDVMSWVMDQEPICATGTGGRKLRPNVGNCWDYFTVLYEYPKKVGITFSSRQFNGHGTQPDGYWNRMFGTEGVLETKYGGQVLVRSKDFYKGETPSIYAQGAKNNLAAFYDSITHGHYKNPTVAPSVRSNLVSILGYNASMENRRYTWKELMASTEKIDGELEGLKS